MKFPFARFAITGASMEPSYVEGDHVLVFRWGKINSGDAIVFYKDGLKMLKRAIKSERGGWLVEGDNKPKSASSEDFGIVKNGNIIGCAVYKY